MTKKKLPRGASPLLAAALGATGALSASHLTREEPPPARVIEPCVLEGPQNFPATVLNIVDADTFDARIDLPFGVSYTDRFRLKNVNAPEMHTVKRTSEEYARGLAAKMWVAEWMDGTQYQVILTTTQKRGARGRYLTTVQNKSGGDLENGMVKNNHGVVFE